MKIILAALISLTIFQSSFGASFDCKKASTLVEQAICSDTLLSNLDELLATSYQEALKNTANRTALRNVQRSWIKSTRNPCKTVECLKEAYTLRISKLNKMTNYTATKFLQDLETQYISTVDDISADQKAAIISSKLLRSNEVCDNKLESNFDLWYVAKRKNSFIKLGRCGTGDKVNIHLYKHKNGGNIGLIVSIMGNHGQVQNFQFFSITKKGEIEKKLTLEDLDLYYISENAFLSPSQQLPKNKNDVAFLYINDDGRIECNPYTWMQPQWQHRNIIRKIWFEWNGEKFIKQVKKINN